MIVIFLNNKLVTCDAILPVMMEVHEKHPETNIRFCCFDEETYDVISRNVVLFDAIESIGVLSLIGGTAIESPNKFQRSWKRLCQLMKILLSALARKTVYLHFKALDGWPLRLLFILNRNRTVLCEPTAIGYSEIERKVANIIHPRVDETTKPAAGRLLGFQPDWVQFKNPNMEKLPRHIVSKARQRKVWLDFIKSRSDEDFHQAFAQSGVQETEVIIAYMVGWFGPLGSLRDPESSKMLLAETLSILADEAGTVPVFIKPHAITDMTHLVSAVKAVQKRNFIITNLHPAVLATRAKALIANYMTSTFADAHFMNVPTIHYTDFSDETLAVTGNGSPRPEFVSYFINRDEIRFRKTLREVLSKKSSKIPEGVFGHDDGFIDWLGMCGREVRK